MEYYMDEKWKVSSKDDKNRKPSTSRSSTKSSILQKSFSQKNNTSTKSSSSSLLRSSSQRCSDFTRKCGSLAKEQKAKFYIVKRCISMLVSWKKNNGSDS